MTIDNLAGAALLILQVLALVWACVVGLRIVFGVRLNERGNPVATKPRGVALLMGTKAALRGTKAVVDGATSAINKVISDPRTENTQPVVIDVWGTEPKPESNIKFTDIKEKQAS